MAHEYRESIRLAIETLLEHKLRSFLTVLGVVMGVSVLMLVAALLAGFNQSVVDTISSFGADTARSLVSTRLQLSGVRARWRSACENRLLSKTRRLWQFVARPFKRPPPG